MARPACKPFSAADDAVLLELRVAGQSWRSIGKRLGQWHVSCQRRHEKLGRPGRVLGLRSREVEKSSPRTTASRADHRGSEPLPAGHPVSWGAIMLPSDFRP